jgi:beta-propeller repeat-containing protein
VDSSGNAYVSGFTCSTNFPTMNPIQGAAGGCDGFVAKLNAAGSALVYSTYLGGSNGDNGTAIALDSAGNAYVTGGTASTDFPTMNPIQGANAGGADAFVTKLNAAGSALVYSTYLGGSGADYGYGIARGLFGQRLRHREHLLDQLPHDEPHPGCERWQSGRLRRQTECGRQRARVLHLSGGQQLRPGRCHRRGLL